MTRRDSVVASAANALRSLIEDEFDVGDQLPNEKQLAERLDVSRGSVREALGVLATEGRVSRRWGVGTFVAQPRANSALTMTSIKSYRDRIRAAGGEVALVSCTTERHPAPAAAAAELGIEPGDDVWRVIRLFSVDGTPSALMTEYIPVVLRGVPVDPGSMSNIEVSLFDMLDSHVEGIVAHTTTDLQAVLVGEADLKALGIPRSLPVLRTEQLTLDGQDAVIAYSITLQRTDVVRMRIVR
ncbi:MAG: GntR family transcriptional regulator [Microbacterium sp.]